MNKLRKGKNSPNWGKKRPDVALRIGKNHPLFGKTGINAPMYGKIHSNEAKRKISLNNAKSMKDKKGIVNKKSKKIIDTNTGIIYYGVREASEGLNIPKGTLCNYLYNRTKNKTNLKWLEK